MVLGKICEVRKLGEASDTLGMTMIGVSTPLTPCLSYESIIHGVDFSLS